MRKVDGIGWSANFNETGIGISFTGVGKWKTGARQCQFRFDEVKTARFKPKSLFSYGELQIETDEENFVLSFSGKSQLHVQCLVNLIRSASPDAFNNVPTTRPKTTQAVSVRAGHINHPTEFTFPSPEQINAVINAVRTGEPHDGLVTMSEYEFEINVVGESNYQSGIRKIAKGRSTSGLRGIPGFLLAEPENEYDENAVAVYLIHENSMTSIKVGYLPRYDAEEVSDAILSAQRVGQIYPLTANLGGGTAEKPNYGVFAAIFVDLDI